MFDESIESLEIPQNVIEISLSIELKPSRLKVKWEAPQEELSPLHSLLLVNITIWSRIASAVFRAPQPPHVEVDYVYELEHVIQGIYVEEIDFVECWRDDSKDSRNCRGSQLLDEAALTLRKLGDHHEEVVHIQELVDCIPHFPW
jgi:hypothetical protein